MAKIFKNLMSNSRTQSCWRRAKKHPEKLQPAVQKDLQQGCSRPCSSSHLCSSSEAEVILLQPAAATEQNRSPVKTHHHQGVRTTKAPILYGEQAAQLPPPAEGGGTTGPATPLVLLGSWRKGGTETRLGWGRHCASRPTICQIRNTLHRKAVAGLRP